MGTAVVLGTFDGLHKGHRAVIEKARGYYTVAVTFDIPPKAYLGEDTQLLMLPCDKAAGLKKLGVNKVCTLDFSKTKDISAKEFFSFLKKEFSPDLIVCGFNYRFGKDAKGDSKMLSRFCSDNGIGFKAVDCVGDGTPVSSSLLRSLIVSGDVEKANEQIFGGFGFTGAVVHGDSRGTSLGFPTANQVFPKMLVRPKFGVYKSKVLIDNKEYEGITNIGIRPTYKTDFIGCETYIKGLNSEIYGKEITLKFLKFIRGEQKFSSRSDLKNAVKADIKAALDIEI